MKNTNTNLRISLRERPSPVQLYKLANQAGLYNYMQSFVLVFRTPFWPGTPNWLVTPNLARTTIFLTEMSIYFGWTQI